MYGNHRLLRTKFLPLFAQRRCPARSQKMWGRGTVSRSDGLWRIQGTVWRKSGAVRTLRPASFKHKNNTLQLCSQQPKTNFGRLNNYIRFYLWKRKIPPMQRSDDFVGWIGGKIDRVCCGAVKIFMENKSSPLCTFLQDRVCAAMKAPVGLLSGSAVLRKQDGGALPRQARWDLR